MMPMTTLTCEHMTAREFQEALTSAKPGEVFIYATGFLAADLPQAFLNKGDPGVAELNTLAQLALKASDKGNAFLTQRRIGHGRFEYRAQKPNGLPAQPGSDAATLSPHEKRLTYDD
jgi:hypothetical protein